MPRSQFPAVIRLKSFDDALCGFGDPFNAILKIATTTVGKRLLWIDREAGLSSGMGTEYKSDAIKGTTHIVGNVANNSAPNLGRETSKLDPIDVASLFGIGIFDEGVRLTIHKGLNLPLEFVQMFVRPRQLQPGIFQRVIHELYSKYAEENRQANTKNSQGLRNTNSHQGRRVQGAEEGGGAYRERLRDYQPPGEGLAQTELSPSPDSSISRHTRSGSLEDA
jgi:hypothetical protein